MPLWGRDASSEGSGGPPLGRHAPEDLFRRPNVALVRLGNIDYPYISLDISMGEVCLSCHIGEKLCSCIVCSACEGLQSDRGLHHIYKLEKFRPPSASQHSWLNPCTFIPRQSVTDHAKRERPFMQAADTDALTSPIYFSYKRPCPRDERADPRASGIQRNVSRYSYGLSMAELPYRGGSVFLHNLLCM